VVGVAAIRDAAGVAIVVVAAAAVVEEAVAVVVEPLPPTQVILRFLHGAEHRTDAFASVQLDSCCWILRGGFFVGRLGVCQNTVIKHYDRKTNYTTMGVSSFSLG